ncbi:MAG: DUF4198 domain-containing protein [Caulobacteraceae bacterium]
MKASRLALLGLAIPVLALSGAAPALAHFQMLYVPNASLDKGAATTMGVVFTHPFPGGPTMNMGKPLAFYVVAQRGTDGAPKKTDLAQYLKPIQWKADEGMIAAYQADLPREVVRSLGDYVFVLEPDPYLEKEEDKYIQQITKLVMNVGGVPGNWDKPLGLAAEIQPLDRPYANWAGGVFSGVVLSAGKPVPFAEIEVEYMNHAPDMTGHTFAKQASVDAPTAAYNAMKVRSDANGTFTIGLPRAGWWGIAALGVGPETKHDGKPLSQDAVIWVQAKAMTSARAPTKTTAKAAK